MTLVRELSNMMLIKSRVVEQAWVPLRPGFTPTSALVSALRVSQQPPPPLEPLGTAPRAHPAPHTLPRATRFGVF